MQESARERERERERERKRQEINLRLEDRKEMVIQNKMSEMGKYRNRERGIMTE